MQPTITSLDDEGNLHIDARVIPLPNSISEAARKFLATPFPLTPEPDLLDKDGWRRLVAAADKMLEPMAQKLLANAAASVTREDLGGAIAYFSEPHNLQNAEWVHLTIHGGSWAFMGGEYARAEAVVNAVAYGCPTFSLDYRMPPDHPFPAAVDDAYTAYKELLTRYDSKKIIISGLSAGGNIVAAVTLMARDNGLPLPAAIGLFSASLDLTRSGDSIYTNDGIDNVLRPFRKAGALYAGGHDLKDPYLSPLFADFTKGFPPTFVQSGTRDLLLSDSVRLHRKLCEADIETELHLWEGMPHGGFGGAIAGLPAPEDQEVRSEFLKFLHRHLGNR